MSEERPSVPPPGIVRAGGGDVLVVDDFADALALYEALLSDDGHSVRVASSGIDALRQVDEREPEVVLLDVSMPGMDGLEVLRRLRARRGGGPAVLMLTAARREPSAIEVGLKEGADAYLTKPIDSRELLARTRAAVDAFRFRRLVESQRRDHIAMLVHDLRHPLSSLSLIAELLDGDEFSVEERRESVAQIRSLCGEMTRLVDGVLAASRLEAGLFTVEKRTVELRTVVSPMLSVFSPIANRRRVTLAFEGTLEQMISCDPPKLRQAIDNLVANALKFTPRGGRVRVRVTREKTADSPPRSTLCIYVADSGPGISDAERASVFERYRQGSHGRTAGGAGLGLAIARGIADAHGGLLELVPSDLGGAAFRMAIPV